MKRFLAFISCAALLLMQACHEDPYLTVGPSDLAFQQEGGSQTVHVSANYAWTASVSGSGLTVSPLSGEGEATVTISAAPATSASPSTGSVTFRSEGLSASVAVHQDAKSTINVGPAAKIPAEGGTFTVDIQYNTGYTVEVESGAMSWIKFNGTKALDSGKLEFIFAENDKAEPRTGKVTVKDNGGKVEPITLTFEQEEKKVIQVGEAMKIPTEGGTFEVDVKYNTDFTVEVEQSAQSWITFVKTKALQSGKLEFSFKANDANERSGKVTIKDKNGKASPVDITFVQAGISVLSKAQSILDDFYEKLGGKNWKDPWIPGKHYPGLDYDEEKGKVMLQINMQGMKGSIPESIGELGDMVYAFQILNEPGLTGKLPDSFRKLVALEYLTLSSTGMTSLPDLFADMKSLRHVEIFNNEDMAGTLPYSIDSPDLEFLNLSRNKFTGSLPASWARLGTGNYNFVYNCLSGKIPHEYLETGDAQVNLQNMLWQKEGYGFDISDIEIKGYSGWPTAALQDKPIEDMEGNLFKYGDVIKENRYTVFVSWAPWCPFSKELMPQLKDYYDLYQQDGLEVIATVMLTDDGHIWDDFEGQKKEIAAKGYGKWHNFYWQSAEPYSYTPFTPAVEVYDSEGYIQFSNLSKYPDPVRKRFNRNPATELIPFLETKFGPAEPEDTYSSKDYSKDGEVMTLQKASAGKGIDIVFMGDGYTDRDMGKNGLYETLMKQSMEEFFAIEPYKTFRDRFNVYAVKVVSKNGRIGEGYETALATQFGIGSEVWGDYDKCVAYAKKIPSIKNQDNLAIAVLVNSRRHAGMTQLNAEHQSGIAFLSANGNDPELFGSTLRHELGGHGMAFLADEYATYSGSAPASHITYYNDVYKKYGWFANVDFTNDKSKVRWSAFLSDDRYKGEVGIFEGGALYEKGAYRPSENSMMNMNFEYFNAPSRWAIYQQIMKRSGEEASFEKFLEYDAVNRAAASHSATAAASRPPMKAAANSPHRTFIPTAPPVIVK